MSTIRIVWGTGTAPTRQASYDVALADAGICDYNLISVSSVIPASAQIRPIGTAPDLGAIGNRLTVVQARETARGCSQVSAALAWEKSSSDGPGLFYETAGETDPETVRSRALEGLSVGKSLRKWDFEDRELDDESRFGTDEKSEAIGESLDGLSSTTQSDSVRHTYQTDGGDGPTENSGVHVESIAASEKLYATALVVGIYGESEPIL